jgi:hypothetical protein
VSHQDSNALNLMDEGMLSRTLAYGSIGRNTQSIMLLVVLGCVINADSVTAALMQGTWLVVFLIILVVVRMCETVLHRHLQYRN